MPGFVAVTCGGHFCTGRHATAGQQQASRHRHATCQHADELSVEVPAVAVAPHSQPLVPHQVSQLLHTMVPCRAHLLLPQPLVPQCSGAAGQEWLGCIATARIGRPGWHVGTGAGPASAASDGAGTAGVAECMARKQAMSYLGCMSSRHEPFVRAAATALERVHRSGDRGPGWLEDRVADRSAGCAVNRLTGCACDSVGPSCCQPTAVGISIRACM